MPCTYLAAVLCLPKLFCYNWDLIILDPVFPTLHTHYRLLEISSSQNSYIMFSFLYCPSNIEFVTSSLFTFIITEFTLLTRATPLSLYCWGEDIEKSPGCRGLFGVSLLHTYFLPSALFLIRLEFVLVKSHSCPKY